MILASWEIMVFYWVGWAALAACALLFVTALWWWALHRTLRIMNAGEAVRIWLVEEWYPRKNSEHPESRVRRALAFLEKKKDGQAVQALLRSELINYKKNE